MRVTVMGAGNSGLAMSAHLSAEGNRVTLWNRTEATIADLQKSREIACSGLLNGVIPIFQVTSDIRIALEGSDVILITTPASAHRDLAEIIGRNLAEPLPVLLNPGRTFGALEFQLVYSKFNEKIEPTVAEAQSIIYTCRKTDASSVRIIMMKSGVLLSTMVAEQNNSFITKLPRCIRHNFVPARSIVETSIGNVGMILHCAPLLLNAGWTENLSNTYKYYYDGITPTVSRLLEKIDQERIAVSERLGFQVESTKEWLQRTYNVKGDSLYDCLQNNEAYRMIDAPQTLEHRYIYEDVPCGLVPLEAMGISLGLGMNFTSLIIDLASKLMGVDFRNTGRNLQSLEINQDGGIFAGVQ